NKAPKAPKASRPPGLEGAAKRKRQDLIVVGLLGVAIILAGAITYLQFGGHQGLAGMAYITPVASPSPQPASPSAIPARPTQESAEVQLLADPIDGPFFREFRELLPADYATVMSGLLAEIPDPSRDM